MHSIEIKMTQIHLKIRKKPRCSNGLTAPNKCAYMIFFVYFSLVLFLCPSFRGILCVLDFCLHLQFCWASFFYLKRIILWRVTSKVLRETSLTTNFLPLIFFRVPFGKKITVPKESTWMKKKINHRIEKMMYRMISQAWTCNLMDFRFFFVRNHRENLIVRGSFDLFFPCLKFNFGWA